MIQSETNPQDVLSDEILADTERQGKRAIRNAKREAQATLDKAKAESRKARSDKLAAARTSAERARARTLATLPVDIGRMRAARVEKELLAVREEVRDELVNRRGFDYGETLVTLAAEAVARMEGDAFVLEISASDRRSFEALLVSNVPERAGRPNITVRIGDPTVNICNGVFIRDSQGRQIWDNRLEARLDRMWPLLRGTLAEHIGLNATEERPGGQS